MSTVPIKPWIEVASLHPDVLAENFSDLLKSERVYLLARN
jgi:hypothetical protein